MIHLDIGTLIVFGLLTLAILSIWLPARICILRARVWMWLFGFSALAGFYYGIVGPGGVLSLVVLGACCRLTTMEKLPKPLRVLCGFVVIGLVVLLFLHKVPYFTNPLVFNEVYFSGRSTAYFKYWNYDKAAAGLLLLAYFGQICRQADCFTRVFKAVWPVSMVTVGVTLSLAAGFHYIVPDVKVGGVLLLWAWGNLFFTCVAEEMLFRGMAQRCLSTINSAKAYQVFVVILVGALFGLAHAGGGYTYVMLATVAGIGYGYAYYRSGRIEAAILTHFLLNAVHAVLFTYPALKI